MYLKGYVGTLCVYVCGPKNS